MFPVLADNTVLTSVKALIENQEAPSYFRNSSFAQLIELLVLADLIYVDDMSFRISKIGGFLSSLNPGLTNIVTGLEVSDADRASAVTFAQQTSKSIGYQFSNDVDELHQLRGYFYLFLANRTDLPYFPIEQRSLFLSPLESGMNNVAVFRKVFEVYEEFRFEAYEELKTRGMLKGKYSGLPYPPIFYNVLARASNLYELFEIALDLRNSRKAISFRKWCADMIDAERHEDYISVRKMFEEMENFLKQICTYEPANYRVELQISFPPALKVPDILPYFRRKRHLLFLKQALSNRRQGEIENKLNELLQLK
jgi:hypothetical protein